MGTVLHMATPKFFLLKVPYLYSMGIFAIEIFLLDFPFKGRKRTCKVCLRFQRCHINFSGVIDFAEIVSAASMTPLKSLLDEKTESKISRNCPFKDADQYANSHY
jgi:hypothetical protein